jgi:hypothetical protein
LNKRTYKKHKEHAEDMSYENEVDKSFLDDLLNNTPHEEQFEENLDKK